MARTKRAPCPQTDALNARLGKTVTRLRAAQALSISALSEQSGVAKSMISQIEKNEANPSVATLFRLSQALGTSVEDMLGQVPPTSAILDHARNQDTPLIRSEDGLCELRILSSIDTVSWAQTYDFRAQPGGVLESSPHPDRTVENLSVISGTLEVEIEDMTTTVKAGETLRYRGDREHTLRNTGSTHAHAIMVNLCAPEGVGFAANDLNGPF